MKHEKLKKLLHQRGVIKRQRKKANKPDDQADQKLQLNYLAVEETPKEKWTAAFNDIRRQNVQEVLNKFKHPFSQHIRLKPYHDAGIWLHWLGVVSDLTLPNANDNLNGDLLIDKLTTGDFQELLDFHVWLNLQNIKYVKSHRQKVGIGDIIEGYSKILRYNHNKYGLGDTVINKAGIFRGKKGPEFLDGKYDRQDDWIIEIDNSAASERAWQTYQKTGSLLEFENVPGHVEVKYQPSRYQRYRDRLAKLKRRPSDSVLPLVNKQPQTYRGRVKQIKAVKSPTVSYRVPQLVLSKVKNDHDRLVAATASLPYTQGMKKMGELQPGDLVTFTSKASSEEDYLFGLIENFVLQTKHPYYPLPEFPNTFLGYLLWRYPNNKWAPSLILDYQNWALARNIHTAEIKEDIAELLPTRALTEHELAVRFGVTDSLINSIYRQGLIKPVGGESERRYDLAAFKTIMQLLAAQDPHSVKIVKKQLPVLSEDDLARKLKLSVKEIRRSMKKLALLPLNGFHYKVNLYGQKVVTILKQAANESLQMQLTKKTPQAVLQRLPLPRRMGLQALPVPVVRQVRREEHIFGAQAKAKDNVVLKLRTFDGSYLCDQFKNFDEADDFIEKTAANRYSNQFLHVRDLLTGKKAVISTKAILSFSEK